MPMIESTPLRVTLVVEVDGHRLEFVESPRASYGVRGARYHGADPRDQGYSTDNSLEARVRAAVSACTDLAQGRALETVRRLYPVADDAPEHGRG